LSPILLANEREKPRLLVVLTSDHYLIDDRGRLEPPNRGGASFLLITRLK